MFKKTYHATHPDMMADRLAGSKRPVRDCGAHAGLPADANRQL